MTGLLILQDLRKLREQIKRSLAGDASFHTTSTHALDFPGACLPQAGPILRASVSCEGWGFRRTLRQPFRRTPTSRAGPTLQRLSACAARIASPPRPLSLHLRYLNDCVIISRVLISSRQGGYMVHAARASTASAPDFAPSLSYGSSYWKDLRCGLGEISGGLV